MSISCFNVTVHPSENQHSFRNSIQLDKQDFGELLTKVTPFILKQDANMRESITPAEGVTLRLDILLSFVFAGNFAFFLSFL